MEIRKKISLGERVINSKFSENTSAGRVLRWATIGTKRHIIEGEHSTMIIREQYVYKNIVFGGKRTIGGQITRVTGTNED